MLSKFACILWWLKDHRLRRYLSNYYLKFSFFTSILSIFTDIAYPWLLYVSGTNFYIAWFCSTLRLVLDKFNVKTALASPRHGMACLLCWGCHSFLSSCNQDASEQHCAGGHCDMGRGLMWESWQRGDWECSRLSRWCCMSDIFILRVEYVGSQHLLK